MTINKILKIFPVIILLVSPYYAFAQKSNVEAYDTAVTKFWNDLYLSGGWTLYCGYRFDYTHKTKDGKVLSIEQIYPAAWMIKYLKCKSRMQCRQSDNGLFMKMEADLHNMYPVWRSIYSTRRDALFGIVDGEDWRFDSCDFERKLGITEPRPIARGNIARAIFYMNKVYGVPLDKEMLVILKRWNREDPPSTQEKRRNNIIERIQGKRNPYIDNPALAEELIMSQTAR
jgi:deoxyribonuclease-1